MTDLTIVSTFPVLLQSLAPCFTAPSFESFVTMMSGWVLNLRRHTVTGAIRAVGAVGHKHISSFHRLLSRGRWNTDEVGLALAHLIISTLLDEHAKRHAP